MSYIVLRATKKNTKEAVKECNIIGDPRIMLKSKNSLVRLSAAKMDFSVFGESREGTLEQLLACTREAIKEGTLVQAARVNVSSLDEVFEKTNHIDCPWTENESVEVFNHGDALAMSSTSVGDIIIEEKTRRSFVVAPFGFKEVTK